MPTSYFAGIKIQYGLVRSPHDFFRLRGHHHKDLGREHPGTDREPTDHTDLTGYTKAIYSIVASVDNKYLVTGALDMKVGVWDIAERKNVAMLEGHRDTICAVAVTHDISFIVSGSADCTIRIWSLKDFNEVQQLSYKGGIVESLAMNCDVDTWQ